MDSGPGGIPRMKIFVPKETDPIETRAALDPIGARALRDLVTVGDVPERVLDVLVGDLATLPQIV